MSQDNGVQQWKEDNLQGGSETKCNQSAQGKCFVVLATEVAGMWQSTSVNDGEEDTAGGGKEQECFGEIAAKVHLKSRWIRL